MKIKIDEAAVSEALHDLADAAVLYQVKSMKNSLEQDLKNPPSYGVFYNNRKKDIKEIKKHIKAAKLVISWFEVPE